MANLLKDQCSAYNNNSRCTNPVLKCKKHCSTHIGKANTLYNKYKQLSNLVDKMDLNKSFPNIDQNIDYLFKCYNILNKCYDARTKHHNYAFVPECSDSGHNYQFVRLKSLIEECEMKLSKLYELDVTNKNLPDKSEESEDIPIKEPEIVDIPKKINEFHKIREQSALEADVLIEKYIKANRLMLEKRNTLTDLIIKSVHELFEEADPDDELSLSNKCIIMYNLVRTLYINNYFLDTFKPDRCNDRKCKCFIPYNLELACPCIYQCDTINSYFNLSSETSINKFYDLISVNKSKVLSFVDDIMDLYDNYGEHIMFMKVQLSWNPIESILVLEERFEYEPELSKISKLMATSRIKHKYLNQGFYI